MQFSYLLLLFLKFLEDKSVTALAPKFKTAQVKLSWDSLDGAKAHDFWFSFHVSIRDNAYALWAINQTHSHIKFKYLSSPDLFFGYHTCSASLISTQHLLTSAQCVLYKNPLDLQVVIGTTSLSSSGALHAVSHIHVHPNYFRHNIAILKMIPAFVKSEVAFYTLLQKKPFNSRSNSVLSGWGGMNKSLCNYLQYGQLKWLSSEMCRNKYNIKLTDKQFCAVTDKDKGTCVGNLGSPLITYNIKAFIIRLLGIISYSELCDEEQPIVFTNVSLYIPWIRDKCDNCILF